LRRNVLKLSTRTLEKRGWVRNMVSLRSVLPCSFLRGVNGWSVVRSVSREFVFCNALAVCISPVPHHRHLVQRGLAVEDDIVSIHQMTFNQVAWMQVHIAGTGNITEIEPHPIITDHIVGTGVFVRALLVSTRRVENECV
jgi:hypothetical protein